MEKPFVIVVTGRPGSGKTTLAHLLANRIHCPAFCRDEFKEGFVHTVGGNRAALGKEANWAVYETFFETVDLAISRGISLVIEAAFQHKLWAPKLLPLMQVAHVSIILCTVAPGLARSRCIERGMQDLTRERFHGDSALFPAQEGKEEAAAELDYSPPNLPVPLLSVDTTNGYCPDVDAIISFAMQSSGATDL